MRVPVRLTTRVVLVVLVAALLAPIASLSSSPARSPYVSAISDLVAATANAAPPTCPNTGCNRNNHCSKAHGYSCVYAAGECNQSAC